MSNPERETYSTVFASLRHPIRRKILRTLSAGPKSFSDMQRIFGIESSHLTYHLESLGNLVSKTAEGKYALSSLGEAAVSMMNQVEGPPTPRVKFSFPSKKWKHIVAALMVGIILLSASFFLEYQSSNQLSAQNSSLRTQNELLEEALRQGLNLGNGSLVYEFAANGAVAPALETLNINGNYSTFTQPLGHSFDAYWIYSMANGTLDLGVTFPNASQEEPGLDVTIWVPTTITQNISNVTFANNTQYSSTQDSAIVYYGFARFNVSKNSILSAPLPSSGKYEISVAAPNVANMADVNEINYTITLQLSIQGTDSPFFFLGSGMGIA